MKINYEKQLFLYSKNRGLAELTYLRYRDTMRLLLKEFPNLHEVEFEKIQEYTANIKNDNYRKSTCVVIRLVFDKILHRPVDWRLLPYPKRQMKIQEIYSHEEIMKVFHSVKHLKQKAILGLLIDKGLRISEPLNIKLSDCNSIEGKIIIHGKGNKQRIIYPSEFWWNLLKSYWKDMDKKPKVYLFEGDKAGKPYSKESIRAFIERHCKIVGVKYKGVHAIRRMNGTWSVENGVPETVVADALGHNSVKTLHRHYLIHSPYYLKQIASPLR